MKPGSAICPISIAPSAAVSAPRRRKSVRPRGRRGTHEGKPCASAHLRPQLLRRGARRRQRIVIEDRRQPFFHGGKGLALALGVIIDLVALDLADAEII